MLVLWEGVRGREGRWEAEKGLCRVAVVALWRRRLKKLVSSPRFGDDYGEQFLSLGNGFTYIITVDCLSVIVCVCVSIQWST